MEDAELKVGEEQVFGSSSQLVPLGSASLCRSKLLHV